MQSNSSVSTSQKLMMEFAEQTGLTQNTGEPRRYLWTDAFAVCNFLELYRQTGDVKFKSLAILLVDQVHNILGRHRVGDVRTGWISGMADEEGKLHPTAGGLRIGKKLKEREQFEPFDENLEWDRDGQYYHYLTKWMHALNCVSRFTADPTYNIWAMELAKAVHSRFVFTFPPGDRKYLYWKMSIDLSRPLVPAMGQLDPLDGLITYSQLMNSARSSPAQSRIPDLHKEIAELADLSNGGSWITDDPLGIGGLLCGAYHMAQMIIRKGFEQRDLLEILLVSALEGLDSSTLRSTLAYPAEYRLAFRELGLSVGIHAAERLMQLLKEKPVMFMNAEVLLSHIDSLLKYQSSAENIEKFWLEDSSRRTDFWQEHRDINMVMLATSLVPDGYLNINYIRKKSDAGK